MSGTKSELPRCQCGAITDVDHRARIANGYKNHLFRPVPARKRKQK